MQKNQTAYGIWHPGIRHIPSNFTSKDWFQKLKTTVISSQHHVDENKLKQLETV